MIVTNKISYFSVGGVDKNQVLKDGILFATTDSHADAIVTVMGETQTTDQPIWERNTE